MIRSSRADSIILVMSLVLGITVLTAQWTSAAVGSTTICKWKDNKTGALSFSVDDVPLAGAAAYAAVADPRGIKMTFYVMADLMDSFWGTWADLAPIAAAGHELGVHLYGYNGQSGSASDEATPAVYRAGLQNFKSLIEQHVPGNGRCLTMAWHYSEPSAAASQMVEAEFFIADREATPFLNSASPSLNPVAGSGSMFSLFSGHGMCYVSGQSGTYEMADAAIRFGGWVCPYWHGIDQVGSDSDCSDGSCTFAAYCDYVNSKRDVLWCATIRDVAQYIYERDSSMVQAVSANASQIVLNLTHTLDTTVCAFTFPLTLKTEVDASWDSVTVTQAGATAGTHAITESTKKYVYFSARPNKGQITLAKSTTAVRQPPVIRQVKAAPLPGPNPVRAEVLRDYLMQQEHAMVYDLAGKMIAPETLGQPGIYLVTGSGNGLVEKVVVVR